MDFVNDNLWYFLISTAGSAQVALIVTQLFKKVLPSFPPFLMSFIICAVTLTISTAALGIADGWQCWVLIIFKSLFAALACKGEYDIIKDSYNKYKKEG